MEKHCRVLLPEVRVGDIASICCRDKKLQEQLSQALVMNFDLEQNGQKKIISVLTVIDVLQKTAENDIYVCSIGADAAVLDLDFNDIQSEKNPLKNKKFSDLY